MSGALVFTASLALAGAAAPLAQAPAGPLGRPAAIDRRLGRSVDESVLRARAKLEDARCQRVLTDFRDAAGRTLAENLFALRQTPAGYLGWLVFYSGRQKRACLDPDVHALTSPGIRIVYVCDRQLRETAQRDPGLAGAYIIHEMLHTLGLGEDPPSSVEITRQVIARCGR
jgi:hypothetical protein